MFLPSIFTSAEARPPDVVWISMDTVRADALSCAGVPPGPSRHPTPTTPNIDAIAARGVRFDRFFAHAPSTLSSHASMMTGLDPHGHAIPRNGFPLAPSHPTLAERLRDAGYDSIAVVGSAVLDSDMGLDRGFLWYDDEQPTAKGHSSAEQVVARALGAVDLRADPDRPLFLFVHFYDAHAPYAPPPEYDRFGDLTVHAPPLPELVVRMQKGQASPAEIERVASLYRGEVAYVDAMIGELVRGLRSRELLHEDRPAVLIITADHGETLGDDPVYAWSHGNNVAFEVMHVPLIVEGIGMTFAQGTAVSTPVAMSGLAPTVLSWVGLPEPLGHGVPFPDLVFATPRAADQGWPERPAIPIWFEATRPRAAEAPFGWNNRLLHRGVWVGEYGGWFAPFLNQPFTAFEESQPIDHELAAWLTAWVEAWDSRSPDHTTATFAPSTSATLELLGYVE